MRSGRKGIIATLLAGLALGAVSAPAAAQADDARIRKVESEVRALQRAVFPGGEGRFFNPEVLTPNAQAQPQAQVGTPANTAMVDTLARLDTLETQIAQLTARTEENENAINLLRQELLALKGPAAPAAATAAAPVSGAASAPASAAPAAAAPAAIQPTGVVTPPAAAPRPATPAATTAAKPATTPAATTPAAAKPAAPSAARLAKVQAVLKPATDDAGDDEYSYGFRLYDAKLYPEAQQQLALFLQKYPKHSRVSYGRNLLGRAYLDDGKPREAATYFFQNYQANKQGDRAPDSLLYLAESMILLKDTNRACIALAEFGDTYAALATGRLKDQYERNRGKVTCN